MALISTITTPPVVEGVTQVNSKGNTIIATPVVLIDQNGEFTEPTPVDFGTKITDSTIPTGGVGNLGWLSSIWKTITDRLPVLVGGKIPVDVSSLSVTVNNANLEISNDAGNPIPVSGTVSISNLPTTQVVNTGLSQPLTDTQLRATSVPVSGTFWQVTQPVSASSLPLPTGAATSANQSTSNTSLANIDTKLPSNLTVSSNRLLVDGSAVTQPVSMATAPVGLAYLSTATITRAANTTAYTANDVYGTVFELTNIGASGGFIFISSIDIIFNITSLPSGMSGFAVYLYSSTPPSAITDNLPYSLNSGDRAAIMTLNGFNLTALLARGGGGSVVAEALNINQLFKLANNSTSIWGYLVTLNAFTPAANSETATIRVRSFAP